LVAINPKFQACNPESGPTVRLEQVCDEAKLDEQWSYVGANRTNVGYGMQLIMQQIQS
jgi:hypothetical protein